MNPLTRLRLLLRIVVLFPLAVPFYVLGGTLKGAGLGILAWLDERDRMMDRLLPGWRRP